MATPTEAQISEENKYNEIEILAPSYVDGSAAKGWYQYAVRVQTKRVNARRSVLAKGEQLPTRQAAINSAIAAGDQRAVEFREELRADWFAE